MAAVVLSFLSTVSFAVTKTATTTGNWSTASIWSPSGVPDAADDVIINSGITVTVDSIFVCNNLFLGNSTGSNTTLRITTAGKSLTINGDFKLNPSDKNNTFTLEAGPGTINIAGTFSHWSNTGTNQFKISTGAINFTPAVTINDAGKKLIFTGAGTATFSADFADNQNNVTTFSGCVMNFYGNYSITGSATDWKSLGTANFYGTGTITHSAAITFNNVNLAASASTTLPNAAGDVIVNGSFTINSGASFTMNDDLEVNGALTNNGGSISAGAYTLTMNGAVCSIGGTTSLTLPTLKIGGGATTRDVSCTMSRSTTVSALTFPASKKNYTLTLSSGSVSLTVGGNLTMAQPTAKKKTNLLSLGAGSCSVSGNLTFSGNNNSKDRVCRINSTSGTFSLDGSITWMSNTAVATEEISTSTGTLNFASAVSLTSGTGTIKVTSSGTVNFNSTSNPCFTFGGSNAPVFTTAYASTVNFAKGITVNTTALTFTTGSNAVFKGTASITPNAAITFANVQINSTYTVTAAGNFSVKGNWTNYGTFTPSTYTVTFNGSSLQNISNSSGTETFYKLTVQPYGTIIRMMNDLVVTNTFTMNGASVDANGYTFQLGNGSGAALSYTLGTVYGGTFKRYWPASTAITSTSGNYYGLFPIGTQYQYRPITVNSTVSPTGAGYVLATHTTSAGVQSVTYTDNEGSSIQQIALMRSELSTSGVTGGTYNIGVKFTDLGSQGSVSNLKLLTYTGEVLGSVGTHVTTAGPIGAPTGYRNGLSLSNLNNVWLLGTVNKAATPMYNYVYSRKSGDWNDNNATTGTWSYTPGGSGAACGCLPGGSGYVVIESGHTVTVTANDSVKFIDIMDGANLTINNPRTFNCTGNMTFDGSGSFTNNGTLTVAGELYLTSATSPTANGNVTVNGWFTLNEGASYTQSSGTLTVGGDLTIDGTMSMASGTSLVFNGSGNVLKGTGTYTTASGGSFPITNSKLIYPGTNLTIGTSGTNTTLSLAANTTVNNVGIINLNGNLTGANASTSIWLNNATSELNVTGTLLSTGILDAETGPNIVHYSGTGAQDIKVPATTYHTLKAVNGGTKSLTADVEVDNEVILGGSTILDESTYVLFGWADLTMSGTSELKLQRSVEDVYPELNGTYNLSGGTVTINQTADSCQVHEGVYYNLKLNGTKPYSLSLVSNISNNLDVTNSASITENSVLTVGGTFTHSSSGTSTLTDSIAVNGIVLSGGTLRDGTTWYEGGQSINVFGSGGWNKNGGTFTVSDGTVFFSGSDAQTLSGTGATQTFNNIHVNKNGGTVTVGGSTTTLSMNGDMILTGGSLDKGTATNINMTAGNWINNGGTFVPGSGTVTFNGTTEQAIQGEGISTDFNNLTINKSAGALTVGGSIVTINASGNVTLTAGELDAGAATFNLTGGNWTNNGATFTPATSTVTFSGSGAQAINGTAASQTFNNLQVNKSANTLSVSGSTTSLTATGNITLDAGTFDKGTAANIYAKGNWTNNGGTFTYGTGTVHFDGTGAQAINGSASGTSFYNVTVNKSSGTLSLGGSLSSVNLYNNMTLTTGTLSAGSVGINMNAGNWTNNGATFTPGTGTVAFTSTTGAQAINGTAATQSFNNLTINKAGQTLSAGGSTTTLNMSGNVSIEAGTFDIGTATAINVGGNWTNNATFTPGSGTVTFNGTGAQVFGGTTPTTFKHLTLNKASGGASLSQRITVEGDLILTSGILTTTSGNFLTLTETATSTEGSATSHVSGPMKKIGNTDFVFPIGKAGKWRRAKVSELETITTEITAEYFANAYANINSKSDPLVEISPVEYWDIDRQVTSDPVKIKLYWESADESSINNCDFLTIAHWKSTKWEQEPATATMGSDCSGTGGGSIETDGTVTTFSPFTFGGTGGGTLPITLLLFDAVSQGSIVKTTWATALEINNNYFTVERSADGKEFYEVGMVDGAGNSTTTLYYSFDDEKPLDGTSYYRLKQTDYDGAFSYSNIVTVRRNTVESAVNIYPNPASSLVNIAASNVSDDIAVSIYDRFGKQVYTSVYPVSGKRVSSNIQLNVKDALAAGVYFMQVTTGESSFNEKLIIQ